MINNEFSIGTRVRIIPSQISENYPSTWSNIATVVGFVHDKMLSKMNGIGIEVWRCQLLFDLNPQTSLEILQWENQSCRVNVLPIVLEFVF
jgi:hypothetical protein